MFQRIEPVTGPFQQADRALDGGKGGSDLVGEIRDEVRFGLLERAMLGYVPHGQDDAGVPPAVLYDVPVPVHLGGVGPVGFLSELDLPYGYPVGGRLAQAPEDLARGTDLFQRTTPIRVPDAEHPGRRGVDHSYPLARVRRHDRLRGGFEDGLETALLLLDLADVVLYLPGHIIEGPRHLAELVSALDRNGRRVVTGGDSDGRIAGLGKGTRYLTCQQQTRRPRQEDAGEYGAEDAVAQVSQRLPQLVAGNVINQDSFHGTVGGR